MAAKNPSPDAYGRFRVRAKGDTKSPIWSTRIFNPEMHVIAPGDASDSYGNALPAKPYVELGTTNPSDVAQTDPAGSNTNTPDEEPSNEH